MRVLFILLVIGVATGIHYNGLLCTYGPLNNTQEYFFEIPRSIEDALREGWHKTEGPPGPISQLSLYCSAGNYVCLLYASSGFIAGIQLGFPVDDLEVAAIDPNKWFTKWKIPADCNDEPAKEYWTISQYFVSEEFLAEGGPQAANGSTLQDNGVWFSTDSEKLMRVPLTEAEIRSKTLFTKQNCTPRMGTHYYYNMTRELLCENQMPWFVLTSNAKVIGSGLQFFGNLHMQPEYRQWYEEFKSRTVVKSAIPIAPECVYDFADTSVGISLHIYYINNPDSIECQPEDSADSSTIPSAY